MGPAKVLVGVVTPTLLCGANCLHRPRIARRRSQCPVGEYRTVVVLTSAISASWVWWQEVVVGVGHDYGPGARTAELRRRFDLSMS